MFIGIGKPQLGVFRYCFFLKPIVVIMANGIIIYLSIMVNVSISFSFLIDNFLRVGSNGPSVINSSNFYLVLA